MVMHIHQLPQRFNEAPAKDGGKRFPILTGQMDTLELQ